MSRASVSRSAPQPSALSPGDWVQAVKPIYEENEYGARIAVIARKRAVGHILIVYPDGLVDVYFERSGRITICAPEELVRLGGPETGSAPPARGKLRPLV